MSEPATTTKSISCSCFCGNIKFTASVALTTPPTASRCNCNVCRKQAYTALLIPSYDAITLHSPASMDDIPKYKLGANDMYRYYCDKCVCLVFGGGIYHNKFTGKDVEIYNVNLNVVDQPQDGVEVKDFVLEYWDGLHDNWMAGKAKEPWSGGLP